MYQTHGTAYGTELQSWNHSQPMVMRHSHMPMETPFMDRPVHDMRQSNRSSSSSSSKSPSRRRRNEQMYTNENGRMMNRDPTFMEKMKMKMGGMLPMGHKKNGEMVQRPYENSPRAY